MRSVLEILGIVFFFWTFARLIPNWVIFPCVVLYLFYKLVIKADAFNHHGKTRENTCFLDGLSGMLAKIAKADGHVSKSEIKVVEKVFDSLDLSPAKLKRCKDVFRAAKDDDELIENYAYKFTEYSSPDARRLIYEILWEVAVADGRLSNAVDNLLKRVARALGLGMEQYYYYRRLHTGGTSGSANGYTGQARSYESELDAAYRTLGCSPDDSDETVKDAYRNQAKKYHPDKLRAEGLPEPIIEKATQTMAKINNAWNTVRKARKI